MEGNKEVSNSQKEIDYDIPDIKKTKTSESLTLERTTVTRFS